MSKRTSWGICMMVAMIVAVVIGGGIVNLLNNDEAPTDSYTTYQCDVKVRLETNIEIYKEGDRFAKVTGNILRLVTDPLTMYNWDGSKRGYAGDSYRFIEQDSHSIYIDDVMTVEMVGLFKWFGEEYNIYGVDGKKVAIAEFNQFSTHGEMHDMNGNLIAEYRSNFFFNDFDVRIFESCKLDENTVLLIFSSYYSDQHADR